MATTGAVLDGRYQLDQPVGRGSFATVYLATDLRLSAGRHRRHVAVKVLLPHLLAPTEAPGFLARFREEASLLATLDHPHILGLHDYGQVDGAPYVVTPYIAGGSLRDALRRTPLLPLGEVARYLHQVAAALDYAHRRRVVHRDLKPHNILLRADEAHALLADFGVARLLGADASHTDTTLVAGTLAYMAPECFHGRVSRAADIYALGCVLFQLLTGEVPFGGSPERIMEGHLGAAIPALAARSPRPLPAGLQGILDRVLAKRPGERYRTAGELARAAGEQLGSAGAPERRSPAGMGDAGDESDENQPTVPALHRGSLGRGDRRP